MNKYSDYFNEITNDGRIFSLEDVVNIPVEEADFYQPALNYQYGKIGFPNDKTLQKSSDVVYVEGYTRADGTEVRAHYRSKNGHNYSDPSKKVLGTPKEEKERIDKLVSKTERKNTGEITGGASLFEEIEKKALQSEAGAQLQNMIIKNKSLESHILKNKPLSKEYYRISATNGNSIETTDTQNLKCNVNDILRTNEHLYEHIKGIKGNRKIKDDDLVVVPKADSDITQAVKNSSVVINKIRSNIQNIQKNKMSGQNITGLNFKNEGDLYTVLGNTHIYDPKIDNKGNLNMYVVDWYDFSPMANDESIISIVNNNAVKSQSKGDLGNYVLIIKLQYTPEEQKKLFH